MADTQPRASPEGRSRRRTVPRNRPTQMWIRFCRGTQICATAVMKSDFGKYPRLAVVVPSAFLMGGVQTWLDYLVPGLQVSGWHVTVLLVDGFHSDARRYLHQHPFPAVRL